MKYLFLDTNIFLHFEDFEEIPWNTIPGISDECCLDIPADSRPPIPVILGHLC